jgi:hypothetical protein
MFVINPEKYSVPTYRIGPFRTNDIAFNYKLPESNAIEEYFTARFGKGNYFYTPDGRSAIAEALKYYDLKETDVVTILTTTGNVYIAKCVTDTISKFCKWSRKIEKNTKVLLVNHEFGYPYPEIRKLKKLCLPIIEDCAASFFSSDPDNTIGRTGDFVVYSFPKMFPIQIGGLLVSNIDSGYTGDFIDNSTKQYIQKVLSYHIRKKDDLLKKRLSNYKRIRDLISKLGFEERFELIKGIVPSVYMFRKGDRDIDLHGLKEYVWNHGIQCSLLYQEETFFIPAHQNLNEIDIRYIVEVVRSFKNGSSASVSLSTLKP